MAVTCPNCGRELEVRTTFCPHCGQRVPRFKDAQFDDVQVDRFCPRCGQPVAEDETSCPHCGTDLSALDDNAWAAAVANAGLVADVPIGQEGTASAEGLVDETQVIQAPLSAQSQLYASTKRPVQSRRSSNDNWRTAVLGVLVIVALGFVGVAGVKTRGFGLFDWYDEPTNLPGAPEAPAENVVPVEEPPADEPSASSSSDEPEAPATSVEPKESLSAYTWAELSTISKELRHLTRNEALEQLEAYHLVAADGSMTGDVKTVDLGEFGTTSVQLADVYHDDLAGSTGKATFTFITSDLPVLHEMQPTNTNEGGWRESEMRTWLNTEVLAALPEELRHAIEPVYKATNNKGQTTDELDVTDTQDVLWLLSTVEAGGRINYYWGSDPANSNRYNSIINAEGSQYACFAGRVANNEAANQALVMRYNGTATGWWLRSTSPSKSYNYRNVSTLGDPSEYGDATTKLGVRFGFCL